VTKNNILHNFLGIFPFQKLYTKLSKKFASKLTLL